jgi:hypothetical protein
VSSIAIGLTIRVWPQVLLVHLNQNWKLTALFPGRHFCHSVRERERMGRYLGNVEFNVGPAAS